MIFQFYNILWLHTITNEVFSEYCGILHMVAASFSFVRKCQNTVSPTLPIFICIFLNCQGIQNLCFILSSDSYIWLSLISVKYIQCLPLIILLNFFCIIPWLTESVNQPLGGEKYFLSCDTFSIVLYPLHSIKILSCTWNP